MPNRQKHCVCVTRTPTLTDGASYRCVSVEKRRKKYFRKFSTSHKSSRWCKGPWDCRLDSSFPLPTVTLNKLKRKNKNKSSLNGHYYVTVTAHDTNDVTSLTFQKVNREMFIIFRIPYSFLVIECGARTPSKPRGVSRFFSLNVDLVISLPTAHVFIYFLSSPYFFFLLQFDSKSRHGARSLEFRAGYHDLAAFIFFSTSLFFFNFCISSNSSFNTFD